MRNILALAAFACLGLIAARPGRAGAQNAVTVGYPAGWNLVAAPEGTSFAAALGPLYTLQSGDTAYRRSAPTAAVQAAFGYWAYFPQPSVVLLTGPSPASLSVVLPPRQYVMIGDPSLQPVAVSPGADLLLTYDATSHTYAAATSLVAGQGAWAYSDRGVTLTLTILTPPLPPPVPAASPVAAPLATPAGSPVARTPAAPQGLRATVLDSTRVRLDWQPSIGATGYVVLDEFDRHQIAALPHDAISYTLVNLDPDTRYCVTIYAYNAAGPSALSDEVCAQTPALALVLQHTPRGNV